MTKEEALAFLREFTTEIEEQDNRGTASPYFYVIKTAKWVSSYHEGEGDRVIATHEGEVAFIGESEEEIFEQFKKEYNDEKDEDDKDIDSMSGWGLKGFMENKEYEFFWENQEWREECCFFTDTDAKEHLRRNHYHYSKDAHTYVKHFWRAPKVEKFFDAVNKLCEQDEQGADK